MHKGCSLDTKRYVLLRDIKTRLSGTFCQLRVCWQSELHFNLSTLLLGAHETTWSLQQSDNFTPSPLIIFDDLKCPKGGPGVNRFM